MKFSELNLNNDILRSIDRLGYTEATEIQTKSIPVLLQLQDDYVGQAQTGTGKTAAFLIPLIQRLDLDSSDIQALILAPTRELALQVHGELEKLGKDSQVRSLCVYGGTPYARQIKALKYDRPQIVVGTPGRLIDLINQKVLRLSQCEQMIIDEADEMLNMGFLEDVETLIDSVASNRRLWMFSATMPREILKLISKSFKNPMVVKAESQQLSNDDIEQFYLVLNKRDYSRALQMLLVSSPNEHGVVFCETRWETNALAEKLANSGIRALALHGDLSQNQREIALKSFRDMKTRVLVCTDVAARGIDVSHVEFVVNMGLPNKRDAYVHRIGRTGRAGKKGKAVSFVTPDQLRELRAIEKLTGKQMEKYELPSANDLKKQKVLQELERISKIKEAVIERGDEFKLDQSFSFFKDELSLIDKEELIKIFFSYKFNKEMRQIDESLKVTPVKFQRGPQSFSKSQSDRRGNQRRRNGGREGQGQSRRNNENSRRRDDSRRRDEGSSRRRRGSRFS